MILLKATGENSITFHKTDNMGKQHGMGSRGVSRPMAEKQVKKTRKEAKDSDNGGMDRKKMLHMHHEQTLWVYWLIIILGAWMVLAPLTFSYGKDIVQPAGGRSLWLSDELRVLLSKWSDIISGILLIFFGWRSLLPNRPVSMWAACFVGIWLNIAPVLFWAPTPFIYINDTIVGALVIALTILIPGMPNMIMYMKMGGEMPKGWSYNPSSWPQRWSMMILGFLGWVVSRYLASFQLGYIDEIWDPFFGDGSRQVLTSKMSESLPVSDGALGALAYTFEFLMGWMGSPKRWRTMPWMVTFFGILVIPLGLVHIFLVISQPVVVGAWCTFCLLAAAIMLPMIPLEIDEVIAMGQHMKQAVKRNKKFWRVFWKGAEPEEDIPDKRTPPLMDLPKTPGKVINASVYGVSVPVTLAFSTLIGMWLMFAPAVFGVGIEKTAADINHLGGSLLIVVSVISMGEVLRMGRYFNILLGAAIALLPWFMPDSNTALNISSAISGALIIALAFPRGPIREKYGLWDKYIK